jgi:hypothetical protein
MAAKLTRLTQMIEIIKLLVMRKLCFLLFPVLAATLITSQSVFIYNHNIVDK